MRPPGRIWLASSIGLLSMVSVGAVGSASESSGPGFPELHGQQGERFDYANGPMGLICWAAILEAMSDIGKRCEAKEDAGFRAAVDRSLLQLEQHLRERGGWSEEQLSRFKRQMSESDRPADLVCGNEDARLMYRGMSEAGADEINRATDEIISRPGPAEWGTCL